jgi:hypothetical protein
MTELPKTDHAMIRVEMAGFLVKDVIKPEEEFHHDGE